MENTLNIQITITDEQISSLLKGNLENLPDEKIQEILSNALIEFFKTDKGQKLFYKTNGYYDSNPLPTDLLVRMVENAVSKDLIKSTVNEIIEGIKNNYENIIKDAMIMTFSNLFYTEVQKATFNTIMHKVLDEGKQC